jgi:hypothetical protein
MLGRLALEDIPGDLGLALNWDPETGIFVMPADDDLSSRVWVGGDAKVRAIAEDEGWSVGEAKAMLKGG